MEVSKEFLEEAVGVEKELFALFEKKLTEKNVGALIGALGLFYAKIYFAAGKTPKEFKEALNAILMSYKAQWKHIHEPNS